MKTTTTVKKQQLWVKLEKKKQQHCTGSTLFLYISLPLFCTTTTRNFLVTRFMEEMLYTCSCSLFFFTAGHFDNLTLVAAGISHILTAAIKFIHFFSNEIGLRWFLFLALAISLFSTLMKTLKFSRKKHSALLLFFSLFKSGWPWHSPPKRQDCTPAYMKEWDARTDDLVTNKLDA